MPTGVARHFLCGFSSASGHSGALALPEARFIIEESANALPNLSVIL
jgi:hypothetical protein